MLRFFFLTIVLTIIGFSSNNPIEENNEQNICILDTVIIKSKNLTIPERNDRILYHLMVEDWEKPVHWSLSIISDKDTLYKYSSYDQSINHFFHTSFYFGNCEKDYIECKRKWYLTTLHNFYIDTVQVDNIKKRLLFIETSKYFARNNKNEYGENLEKSIRNWEIFWEYYYHKPIVIFNIRCAPEACSTPLLVYHPFLKKFVPIYSP